MTRKEALIIVRAMIVERNDIVKRALRARIASPAANRASIEIVALCKLIPQLTEDKDGK